MTIIRMTIVSVVKWGYVRNLHGLVLWEVLYFGNFGILHYLSKIFNYQRYYGEFGMPDLWNHTNCPDPCLTYSCPKVFIHIRISLLSYIHATHAWHTHAQRFLSTSDCHYWISIIYHTSYNIHYLLSWYDSYIHATHASHTHVQRFLSINIKISLFTTDSSSDTNYLSLIIQYRLSIISYIHGNSCLTYSCPKVFINCHQSIIILKQSLTH